jgi:hypothetical protein
MARKDIQLKKIPGSSLETFKIKNRRGYAAVCMDNLTEGANVNLALARMNKALRRMGYTLG